ncbi:MAG TPA: alpha/beta hydrolase [Capillimicrobium sp.]|jgi:pimeloyl-ACP methyl ester carboxylesterase
MRIKPWAAMAAVGLSLAGGTASAGAATVIEDQYAVAGPYATTTGTISDASGAVVYATYQPASYAALTFDSPIVVWGNGTDATPDKYATLLTRLASHGFTVVAPVAVNVGSGNRLVAAAQKMVALNGTPGSVYAGNLDVGAIATVGHSQGATGATRAAAANPGLIDAVMTFSMPNASFSAANPDCPTAADCTPNPSLLTQPAFLIGTRGFLDGLIASPATQTAYFNSVPGTAALGVLKSSEGKAADHNSIQDAADGGNPGGFLGYATAWLKAKLRGDTTAAGAFGGASPELPGNTRWSPAAVK